MGNSLFVHVKRHGDDDVKKEKDSSQQWSISRASLARLCDAVEAAALWTVGKPKEDNFYLSGNYAPTDEFGPQSSLPVKGTLPECLNGEFVRVGPNPKEKPVAGYHWFDGDGMLHGVRIKDGKVTYVSRYVRTSKLKQEEYWGAAKFLKIGDLNGKAGILWANIYKLRVKFGVLDTSDGTGTGNTALQFHHGQLLALAESDKPYIIRVLEDGNFETIGRNDYDNKLNHPFTAHPKVDPVTGELFTFGYQVDKTPHVTYRVISKDGVMDDPVPITVSGPIMMHDFAITENYAVFMDLPLYFNPEAMSKNNANIFSYDNTKPARFGVLPRYAKSEAEIRWFELSNCVIFHNANAWEEGDEVVLISCRLDHIDLGALDKEKDGGFNNNLWEYRFNMKTGEALERRLGEFQSDFPRINEEFVGRKSRYVYTGLFSSGTQIPGVIKYDLTVEPELGKEKLEVGGNVAGVFRHGNERYGGEPVFVPKTPGSEGEEDDGYLLNFVYDEAKGKSEVVVVDAKTMSSDPVAVIQLPTRIPYGFHGMFITEDQLQSQKA